MKCLIVLVSCLQVFMLGYSQSNPVQWQFNSRKIDESVYEIHITAVVQSPWKIYSQTTPADGPLPTTFSFNKNPLIDLQGKVKEVGTMKTKHEEVFGVDVYYYTGKVDFVQMIKLKTKVKTTLAGKLEYMVCDDEKCLPPKEVAFSITLQ